METERCFLRNFAPEDLPAVYDYRNDPRCGAYQRYEDTGRAYLAGFLRRFSACRLLSLEEEQHYAVCLRSGPLIGDLSVFYTQEDACFTLGITIAGPYQRQGYAYEVLRPLADLLRRTYPAVDLVALIHPENQASVGLFEKLQFVRECYEESIDSLIYVRYGEKG